MRKGFGTTGIVVIVAVIIIFGGAYYLFQNTEPVEPPNNAKTFGQFDGENQAQVPEHMRTCQTNKDCALVDTSCSSCCGYVGINKDFKQIYRDELFSPVCGEYEGPVCRCTGPTNPICVNGICEVQ